MEEEDRPKFPAANHGGGELLLCLDVDCDPGESLSVESGRSVVGAVCLYVQNLAETSLLENIGTGVIHAGKAYTFFAALTHNKQNTQSCGGNVVQGITVNLYFPDGYGVSVRQTVKDLPVVPFVLERVNFCQEMTLMYMQILTGTRTW